jgi:hypothetical protein
VREPRTPAFRRSKQPAPESRWCRPGPHGDGVGVSARPRRGGVRSRVRAGRPSGFSKSWPTFTSVSTVGKHHPQWITSALPAS